MLAFDNFTELCDFRFFLLLLKYAANLTSCSDANVRRLLMLQICQSAPQTATHAKRLRTDSGWPLARIVKLFK